MANGTGDPTGNLFMMGGMTPDQQQQMMRNMYAMSLMGHTTGSTAPQSSFLGGLNQGLSPMVNAVMLRNMMQQNPQQAMPTTAPQGFGMPGGGTSYNPQAGYFSNMAGGMPQGMNITAAQGGVAPQQGLFSRIGSWLTNLGTQGSSGT